MPKTIIYRILYKNLINFPPYRVIDPSFIILRAHFQLLWLRSVLTLNPARKSWFSWSKRRLVSFWSNVQTHEEGRIYDYVS